MKSIAFDIKRIPSSLIAEAAAVLKRGGVMIYPTETLYGLGGNAMQKRVHQRIFRIKGRPPEKHFILLVKDRHMIRRLGLEFPDLAKRLAKKFWPGPLTLILSTTKATPSALQNRSNSLAVRISSSPFIRKLFGAVDFPIISTSSNRSGSTAPVKQSLCDLVMYCVCPQGKPSTVVDARLNKPVLVRRGIIPFSKIKHEAA